MLLPKRCLVALLGATVVFCPAAALPVTLTFDALPRLIDGDYEEKGVRVTGNGFLGYWSVPGRMHIDDSGSGIAHTVVFRASAPFNFVSLDVLGLGSQYFRYFPGDDDDDESIPYEENLAYDNVLLEGFRDGMVVGSELFSTGTNLSQLTIAGLEEFKHLTSLQVSALWPPFTGTKDGVLYYCNDAPCGHFNIDNVRLDVVPLPPALPLLIGAAGLLLIAGCYGRAVGRTRHLA
jgi:hypothetical protein